MAFIFTMRSTPINSRTSMHRREGSTPSTLPAIDEDNPSFDTSSAAPPIPPRALDRPRRSQLGFGLGYPPRSEYDETPPEYDSRDEKLAELRKGLENNRHIAKRGGWKRLAIFAFVLFLVLVGLIVGLVLGLRRGDNVSSSNSSSTSSTPEGGASGTIENPQNITNGPFPLGSYTINTYLSTITTNCTSSPSTWQCYPYTTYKESRTSSLAAFDWIISSASENTYTISSTPNVFSIVFTNTSLNLRNAGQDDEHYFFEVSMRKPTKPTQQLGSQNVAATCYFGDSTLQGNLYTKMAKTYPGSGEEEEGGYEPWPFAVKIEQVASAGVGVPECVSTEGANLGDFSVGDTSQFCDCLYSNTGT